MLLAGLVVYIVIKSDGRFVTVRAMIAIPVGLFIYLTNFSVFITSNSNY
jgi:hypothetical protein